jgi:hypothetical protein
VAIGAAAHATGATVLTLGPHHPSTHGVLQVGSHRARTTWSCAPSRIVGFMHRGAEKLFEVRDYRQLDDAGEPARLAVGVQQRARHLPGARAECSGCRCRTAPCGCARCSPS